MRVRFISKPLLDRVEPPPNPTHASASDAARPMPWPKGNSTISLAI